MVIRGEGPAEPRFQEKAGAVGEIELDPPGAEQGESEPFTADPSPPVKRRAYATVSLDSAAEIDIKPLVGSQGPVQAQRDPEVVRELILIPPEAVSEGGHIQAVLQPGGQFQPFGNGNADGKACPEREMAAVAGGKIIDGYGGIAGATWRKGLR